MNEQSKNVNIDIQSCEDVICTNCECQFFVEAFVVKRIPGLLVGAQQDQPGIGQAKVCLKCFTPFELSFFGPPPEIEESSLLSK